MKNYLGECSLKVTRPNGERSKMLVSNPDYYPKRYRNILLAVILYYSTLSGTNQQILTPKRYDKDPHFL